MGRFLEISYARDLMAPSIFDGTISLTTCFVDVRTGAKRGWSFPAGVGPIENSAPLVDDTAYVACWGALVWWDVTKCDSRRAVMLAPAKTEGASTPASHIPRAAPAVFEGVVMVGADDGDCHAFATTDGKRRWKFSTGGPVRSSPSVAAEDGLVYFGSHDGNLYALEVASGKKQWHLTLDGPIASSPSIHDGVIYVGSEIGVVYALEGEPQ